MPKLNLAAEDAVQDRRYRVLRGISVAAKDGVLSWEEGQIMSGAPPAAIKDWLAIGAIEEVTDG